MHFQICKKMKNLEGVKNLVDFSKMSLEDCVRDAGEELHRIYGDVGERYGVAGQSAILEAFETTLQTELDRLLETAQDASGPSGDRHYQESDQGVGWHDYF